MACMSENSDTSAANTSSCNGLSSVCFWSCRCTVAILGCLSLMNMHAQQMAMSSSLACMLNSSMIVHQVVSLDSHVDPYACEHSGPIRGTLRHNHTSYDVRLKHPQIKISGTILWDRHSQSLILGAFPWGYLFSLIIGGLFAFKSSPHKLLGYSHLAMSLSTLMTPIASLYMHTYAVMGLQFMAGLGAGSTYPGIVALWRRWAPPVERTRLFAVTFCGIPLGVMIATSSIQVTCYYTDGSGWSALFYALGLFGFVWFILWMTLVSSSPEKNRHISEIERQYISKSLGSHDSLYDQADIPWRNVFCSQVLWSLVPIHFSTEWGIYILAYAMPVYLRDVKYTDINRFFNGYFSTAPFAAFLLVVVTSGMLADCLISCCLYQVKTVRKVYATIGSLALSTGIVLLTFTECENRVYLVVVLTAMAGLHGLQYCSSMVTPIDVCLKHAPVVMAFSQTVTQILKIVCVYAVNFYSSEGGQSEWHIILYVSSVAAVISGATFLIFGGGNFKRIKTENLSLAFTNEELSYAVAEPGTSRSVDGSGISNYQTPYSKPFLVVQEPLKLDSISVGVSDHPETRNLGGFEPEGCLLNNSYRSVIKDRRRKMPLVSVV